MTTRSLVAVIQSVAADLGKAGCPFALVWSTVDANLATITERGFARQQDLAAKLTAIRAASG